MTERWPAVLPEDMARARARLEVWRGTRPRVGTPLPAALWRAAAALARRHGVSKVARALGLDYYALRRRVEAPEQRPDERAAGFVEVAIAAPPPVPSCRVEIEDGGTTRLRIELQGLSVEDSGRSCGRCGVRRDHEERVVGDQVRRRSTSSPWSSPAGSTATSSSSSSTCGRKCWS